MIVDMSFPMNVLFTGHRGAEEHLSFSADDIMALEGVMHIKGIGVVMAYHIQVIIFLILEFHILKSFTVNTMKAGLNL